MLATVFLHYLAALLAAWTTVAVPVAMTGAATRTPGAPLSEIRGRPLARWSLFVEADTPARRQAEEWRDPRPGDALMMEQLAAVPQARWIGDWYPDPYGATRAYVDAAAAANALPVLVLYNLPGRDCGNYSAGGASDASEYRAWVNRVSSALGQQPALIVVEPDALAELDCFDGAHRTRVTRLLASTVATLKRDVNARIYIDAGNPRWQSAETMAARLRAGGIGEAHGFSINVSNFLPTNENILYGRRLASLVGNKPFLIDTSRNGAGTDGSWCNPKGRALGEAPTLRTRQPLVDGYLWIKAPGESDGECGRGEPEAGVWWPEYALGLARRAL